MQNQLKINFNWKIYYILGLIGLSIVIYVIHFMIFQDIGHIMIYMIEDLAFLPIYILVVTLGLNEILMRREKRALLRKFNMVVGTFYSEIGSDLLNLFTNFDPNCKKVIQDLLSGFDWSTKNFSAIKKELSHFNYCMECDVSEIIELREYLLSKRNFLLLLLENPTLLDLKSFSELLWAVFHINEELEKVGDIESLSEDKRDHINEDIKNTHIYLVMQWLYYMRELKENDPFLFSLGLKTNPFNMSLEP